MDLFIGVFAERFRSIYESHVVKILAGQRLNVRGMQVLAQSGLHEADIQRGCGKVPSRSDGKQAEQSGEDIFQS